MPHITPLIQNNRINTSFSAKLEITPEAKQEIGVALEEYRELIQKNKQHKVFDEKYSLASYLAAVKNTFETGTSSIPGTVKLDIDTVYKNPDEKLILSYKKSDNDIFESRQQFKDDETSMLLNTDELTIAGLTIPAKAAEWLIHKCAIMKNLTPEVNPFFELSRKILKSKQQNPSLKHD